MNKQIPLLRLFLAFVVILSAIVLTAYAVQHGETHPQTDAAEVAAPVVLISTTVPGRVVEVAVTENQAVQAGDLLFRVDPEPYELELLQAKAALTTAKAELAQGERNLELERSNAAVAVSQIARARNNLTLAQGTLERLTPLLEQGYVTEQEVETAQTAVDDAQVTLAQALSHAEGTNSFVGTLDTRRAQVTLAEAGVALAERNLRNTAMRAPVSGRVTGLNLDPGEYVVTGTPLFSLVDTSTWHVTALFRETDLPHIHVGDEARVFFLSVPDLPIAGEVSGIGWAIRSVDEADLFGLPLVANKIDWVRTARRFPVEIELIDPPEELTRVGLSASVQVHGAAEPHE